MKTNQLDNEFKSKLDTREIKPSAMAWDRLDAMLTVAEKPKRNYNWMYMAASFLGFMLIATVFLSQTETATDKAKTNMVFENKNPNKMEKKVEVVSNNDPLDKIIQSVSKKSNSIEVNKISKKITTEKSTIAENTNQNTKNNKINQTNQNQIVNSSIINQKNEQNNQKINQKSIINHIETTNSIVAENAKNADVDELLAQATALKNVNSKIKINPNDLLSQVDGELELTFREKVIKTVNRNYQTVKVALENRNK